MRSLQPSCIWRHPRPFSATSTRSFSQLRLTYKPKLPRSSVTPNFSLSSPAQRPTAPRRIPALSFRLFGSTAIAMSAFHDLKAELPGGKTLDFQDLKGKVVLIVNVASQCGFTPQYKGLQDLYDKYKDQGFVILGFPCNQFGGQEPGDDAAIGEFCQLNHGVTFPLVKKSDVNGDNTNEVYKHLKNEKAGLLGLTRIKWNFEKFLVDKEGNVVQRWASTTTPAAIDAEVAKLLSA